MTASGRLKGVCDRLEGCIPGFDQVRRCEERTKNNAQTAYHNVGDAEEGVLASHDSASG